MLNEADLLTNFILHHLLAGACLILILSVVVRSFALTAETQSWLWATAFVVCALAPFMPLSQGARPQPVAAEPVAAVNPSPSALGRGTAAATQKSVRPAPADADFQLQLPRHWLDGINSWLNSFLLVWLIGAGWRTAGVLRSFRSTRGIVNESTPYRGGGEWTPFCPVLVSARIRAPMAVGLANPTILLPGVLVERFDRERLAAVILHEWAHIQRGDLWVGGFQELAAVVFWWSPVMRLLNRKIHISRELACDMRAAKALRSGKRYARSLLDCAELMITRKQSPLAMGLFSKKKDLTERVNAVLKSHTAKTPKFLAIAGACGVVAIASLVIAQELAPRIDLASADVGGAGFSAMSRAEGERLIGTVRHGDLRALEGVLATGIDINAPVPGEGTALIEAVRRGSRAMVELLLAAGADVNLASPGDGNPMIAAARHNRIELAQLLHQRGADVDAAIPRDGSPLIVAIRAGHDAMAEQLIDWGADVNLGVERDGSPLIAAAMTGNLKIAQRLQRAGADVNGVVKTDETPLINAAHHGHFELVRFLVENGADVNLGVMANGDEFRTPLNRARNAEIREYLIRMGATE